MNLEGLRKRKDYVHVAAQLMPNENSVEEPERAREYLEEYFGSENISIYWGSVEDFAQDLSDELNRGL